MKRKILDDVIWEGCARLLAGLADPSLSLSLSRALSHTPSITFLSIPPPALTHSLSLFSMLSRLLHARPGCLEQGGEGTKGRFRAWRWRVRHFSGRGNAE